MWLRSRKVSPYITESPTNIPIAAYRANRPSLFYSDDSNSDNEQLGTINEDTGENEDDETPPPPHTASLFDDSDNDTDPGPPIPNISCPKVTQDTLDDDEKVISADTSRKKDSDVLDSRGVARAKKSTSDDSDDESVDSLSTEDYPHLMDIFLKENDNFHKDPQGINVMDYKVWKQEYLKRMKSDDELQNSGKRKAQETDHLPDPPVLSTPQKDVSEHDQDKKPPSVDKVKRVKHYLKSFPSIHNSRNSSSAKAQRDIFRSDKAMEQSYDLTPKIPKEVSNAQGTEDDDDSSIGTMSIGERTFKKANKALETAKKGQDKDKKLMSNDSNSAEIQQKITILDPDPISTQERIKMEEQGWFPTRHAKTGRVSWHRVNYEKVDPKVIQPYLGYRPLRVIKLTLQKTTQMAKMVFNSPLRRHLQPRFGEVFNVKRLDETISTDPIFANCKSLFHNFTGLSSLLWMYVTLYECSWLPF